MSTSDLSRFPMGFSAHASIVGSCIALGKNHGEQGKSSTKGSFSMDIWVGLRIVLHPSLATFLTQNDDILSSPYC